MCHRAPRPPLTFTFQRGATDGGAGTPLARRPRPAAPSRRLYALPRTSAIPRKPAPVTVPGLQCSVLSTLDSVGVSQWKPNRVSEELGNARTRAASHSPAGSVSQAWKWRKRRETAARPCALRHPGLPQRGPTLIYNRPSVRDYNITHQRSSVRFNFLRHFSLNLIFESFKQPFRIIFSIERD